MTQADIQSNMRFSRWVPKTSVSRNRSVLPSCALAAREITMGPGFLSPNRPDKGRNPTYRAGSRQEVWCERPSCYHRRQLGGAIWGISV